MPGIVITNVAAPPEVAPGSDYQVEVTVQSQTILPLPRMARVQLQITGQPVGQAQAVIPPRATAKFTFQVRAPDVPSTMNVPHKVVLLTVIAGIFPIPRGALAFVVTMNPGGSTLPPEPVQPIDTGKGTPAGNGGTTGGQAGTGGTPATATTVGAGSIVVDDTTGFRYPVIAAIPGQGHPTLDSRAAHFESSGQGGTLASYLANGSVGQYLFVEVNGVGKVYDVSPLAVAATTTSPEATPTSPEPSTGSPSAAQTNLPGAGTSRLISGVG